MIHPTLVRPLTPTDILESMLARDDAQRSATSLLREQADPATRLGEAAQRYLDSLYVAAEDLLRRTSAPTTVVDALDSAVDQLVPGLSDEAAWPTLRAHLLLLGAAGENPVEALRAAAERPGAGHAPTTAPRCSTGAWTPPACATPAPARCPGCPASRPAWPTTRTGAPTSPSARTWSTSSPTQVRDRAADTGRRCRPGRRTGSDPTPPRWPTSRSGGQPCRSPPTTGDPTGAPQLQKASATYQRRLNRRVTGDHTPALKEWRQLLYSLAPQVRGDEFTPLLAERLAAMSRAGVTAHQLLRTAAAARPARCPTSTPRPRCGGAWPATSRPPSPPRSATARTARASPPAGHRSCADLLGAERAARIQASTWWPALVSNVDHGLQRGWQLEALLGAGRPLPSDGWDGVDECQALVWRTSIALEPIPDEHAHDYHFDEPPADMWDGVEPDPATFVDHPDDIDWPLADDPGPTSTTGRPGRPDARGRRVDGQRRSTSTRTQYVEGDLTLAALHPRPRRHPAGADRRRHPAHVPAGRGVALLPRHPRAHARDQRAHADLLRGPVHRLVGPRLPHRPVRRRPRRRTSTSAPDRRRPGGPTWSTTCAATASATTRCSPPASPPAPAPAG